MGAAHGHSLHFHGHSWLHRGRPEHKILGTVVFTLLVVATRPEWVAVFVVLAAGLLVVVRSTRVPWTYLARRMVLEVPILVFALALPFVVPGPGVGLGPITMSEAGLVDAAELVTKATLGVVAGLLLAATTEPRDLLRGLQKLRLPAVMVQIIGFMIRYIEVVSQDMERMRVARESRGFDARGLAHWRVLARSAGALFIRTYERGERVHLAMLARGYDGQMP